MLKKDESVIGVMFLMNHGEGTAEIYKLYIFKAFRGINYGAETVNSVITILKEEGFIEVVVEALTIDVVPFWTKLGFIPLDPNWDGNKHFSKVI